ncbi:MAG: hypothetical protein GMKNLPBB_01771 [Myxococcota bacterium]|nr:hypothetical protein [Myxococcota bacterium]
METDKSRLLDFLRAAPEDRLLHTALAESSDLDEAVREDRFWFLLHESGGRIAAVTLFARGGFMSIVGDPEVKTPGMGEWVRERRWNITRLLGPCGAAGSVWREYAGKTAPRLDRLQQTLCFQAGGSGDLPRVGVELAEPGELNQLLLMTEAMLIEDLGIYLNSSDLEQQEIRMKQLIEQGRCFVVRNDRRIIFKAEVGVECAAGCMIEGVYSARAHRGRGLAASAMREISLRLATRFPLVTLQVNVDNKPALRAYSRAGFQPGGLTRLLSV